MIDPIGGIGAADQEAAAQDPSAAPHVKNIAFGTNDSVGLSPAAQVRILRDEGEQFDEIAVQLHLSSYEVLSDLGLTSK